MQTDKEEENMFYNWDAYPGAIVQSYIFSLQEQQVFLFKLRVS